MGAVTPLSSSLRELTKQTDGPDLRFSKIVSKGSQRQQGRRTCPFAGSKQFCNYGLDV